MLASYNDSSCVIIKYTKYTQYSFECQKSVELTGMTFSNTNLYFAGIEKTSKYPIYMKTSFDIEIEKQYMDQEYSSEKLIIKAEKENANFII